MAYELDNVPHFSEVVGSVVAHWPGESKPSPFGGTDLMLGKDWGGRVFTDEAGTVRVVVPDEDSTAKRELEEEMMQAYSLRQATG